MKAGSLVTPIKDILGINAVTKKPVGIPIKKGTILTIRGIAQVSLLNPYVGLYFDEIVNECNCFGTERCYAIQNFRELQPPIANIEEYINENTLELQEL